MKKFLKIFASDLRKEIAGEIYQIVFPTFASSLLLMSALLLNRFYPQIPFYVLFFGISWLIFYGMKKKTDSLRDKLDEAEEREKLVS